MGRDMAEPVIEWIERKATELRPTLGSIPPT